MRERIKLDGKYRKVMIHCAGGELEGYINRAEDEPRTRYNTWNGWECPVFTVEQVKAWLPEQDAYWKDGSGEKWELKFNEENQEHELWIYDFDNCKFNDDDFEDDEEEDGFVRTEHGIFSPEIIYNLCEAETIDGEKIEVFGSPCYCWELADED
tara:strand:+ start:18626 stop:19087 length:462 start_codon:yes stop_codon:yes gene_type:complete